MLFSSAVTTLFLNENSFTACKWTKLDLLSPSIPILVLIPAFLLAIPPFTTPRQLFPSLMSVSQMLLGTQDLFPSHIIEPRQIDRRKTLLTKLSGFLYPFCVVLSGFVVLLPIHSFTMGHVPLSSLPSLQAVTNALQCYSCDSTVENDIEKWSINFTVVVLHNQSEVAVLRAERCEAEEWIFYQQLQLWASQAEDKLLSCTKLNRNFIQVMPQDE